MQNKSHTSVNSSIITLTLFLICWESDHQMKKQKKGPARTQKWLKPVERAKNMTPECKRITPECKENDLFIIFYIVTYIHIFFMRALCAVISFMPSSSLIWKYLHTSSFESLSLRSNLCPSTVVVACCGWPREHLEMTSDVPTKLHAMTQLWLSGSCHSRHAFGEGTHAHPTLLGT